MAKIVVYDPTDPNVPDRVTMYQASANTPDYNGVTDKLVNPDLSLLEGIVPVLFWKRVGTTVVEMNQTEKDLLTPNVPDQNVHNAGQKDPPTADFFLQVYRGGVVDDASIRWDETAKEWKYGLLGSEVPIASVYGTYAQNASSESESATTSSSYQRKLRLTTPALPLGTYCIGWYYEWRYSNTSYDFIGRVQINNTTTIMAHQQEPKDSNSDQHYSHSGFYFHTGSGILDIDLDYKRDFNSSGASYIRRARLMIYRVS